MKKYRLMIPLLIISYLLTSCSLIHKKPTPETSAPSEIIYAPIPQQTLLDTFDDPIAGKSIDYYLYIPKDATEHMPLIVYLHGVGAVGSVKNIETNPLHSCALEIYGESFPFLILTPSSMFNSTWTSKKMPERVKSLVEYIVSEYNIDRDKIIISGHSMGASGVFRQIEHYGDFYSAAIPVSVPDTSIIDIEKCLTTPIQGFAGSKESPFNHDMRELCDSLKELGGNVVYTELEGIVHGKTPYHAFTKEVLDWAITQ